jgi:hypothetical protein
MKLVKIMRYVEKDRFDVASGMPTALAAKLECSASLQLFRLAADHNLQYMVLIDSAWEDISPVVEWFLETRRYQEGIKWLYDNTPDVYARVFSINRLMDAEEKEASNLEQPDITNVSKD